MTVKKKSQECCGPDKRVEREQYSVEAIVSVDDRGQMVLPKEDRQRFGLMPGDKLAVVVMEREGKVCCLQLLKAQSFSEQVKGMIGTPAIGKGGE